MSDEAEDCKCEEGAPAWMGTFADLMSLLMCFFVLLLSFSEIDLQKYKQVAGSMAFAFGVQREIKAEEIPKGTSIVAQEFSPGKPQPTPINEVRQKTTEEFKQNLDFSDSDSKNNQTNSADSLKNLAKALEAKAEEKASELRKALKRQIETGVLEVVVKDDTAIIRILERGSFQSGNASLRKSFLPVMYKVSKALRSIKGKIIVGGHSDNIPINTKKFPSNWVLSAARAANVVHFLTKYGRVKSNRVEIRAHADVVPLVKNSNSNNRARNRRVEISVLGDRNSVANANTLDKPRS